MKKNVIKSYIEFISNRSRERRAELFKDNFLITCDTIILDLGSEKGTNIYRVLIGTDAINKNIYIADINPVLVNEGYVRYGYQPVVLQEDGSLPFDDGFFDIVFCSSVIEHVTLPKNKIWNILSEKKFKNESLRRQKEFAEEIRRVGKQYFVQTPYKYFPIESHTWLPLLGFLPRSLIVFTLRFTNLIWIKKTTPDWHLLSKSQMKYLFPDAQIIEEKICGLTKSIMAVRKI